MKTFTILREFFHFIDWYQGEGFIVGLKFYDKNHNIIAEYIKPNKVNNE